MIFINCLNISGSLAPAGKPKYFADKKTGRACALEYEHRPKASNAVGSSLAKIERFG